jgi:uncharacterized protein (TIGR02466 family)
MNAPTLALSLFPTPVVVFDLPELAAVNQELSKRLLAESATVPSWQRANVGGWHSKPDLSQRPDGCYRTLMQTIVDRVGGCMKVLAADNGVPPAAYRFGLTAWAMVMRDGDYTAIHDHGDSHWSVAYYVDPGDDAPAPSGRIAFVDPRRSGRMIEELGMSSVFDVAPRAGALVIFPGWLQHFVHTYRGQRPRICVSCNVTLQAVPG